MEIISEMVDNRDSCCWRIFRVVKEGDRFAWGYDNGCSDNIPFHNNIGFASYVPLNRQRFDEFEQQVDGTPFTRQVKSDFVDRIAIAIGLTVDEIEVADENDR